jgi:cyclopropane-fatty-acyl-phospholipid synthase
MSNDPHVAAAIRVLTAFTEGFPANFTVRFHTGDTWRPNSGEPGFTLVLKHAGSLRAMFWPFDNVGVGESYIFDDYDIEGDMFAFTGWLRHLVKMMEDRNFLGKLKLLWALKKLPNQKNMRDVSKAGRPTEGDHSRDKDREAISYTYDLPAEFYRLFLDKNFQYTCGTFAHPGEDQDIAQERKMDLICKKLRLKPGDRYVDFGCGWGYLIQHAAKHYGVKATGVTLSGGQAEWAKRVVAESGLADRIRIVISDYRDFQDPEGFDAASSVGMGEHIGVANLPVFMSKVFSNLKPGGRYLHHSITLKPFIPYPRWTAFARKYVFPNGELQTILRVQESAALARFELRDMENLRENYVLTLEAWVRKLEQNQDEVRKLVGDVTYRIFRLYMAGATLGFKHGNYGLNQVLCVKPDADGISHQPLSRADWYA